MRRAAVTAIRIRSANAAIVLVARKGLTCRIDHEVRWHRVQCRQDWGSNSFDLWGTDRRVLALEGFDVQAAIAIGRLRKADTQFSEIHSLYSRGEGLDKYPTGPGAHGNISLPRMCTEQVGASMEAWGSP